MTSRRKPVDLEKSLADLEAIVARLEGGELPLDRALREFEAGVRLSRECQAALAAAEQRVQVLSGGELVDLDAGDAAEEEAGDDLTD